MNDEQEAVPVSDTVRMNRLEQMIYLNEQEAELTQRLYQIRLQKTKLSRLVHEDLKLRLAQAE